LSGPAVLSGLSGAGALLGLSGGLGLWLVVIRVPWSRRPTLDDRLAPYLRDTTRPSRLLQRAGHVGPSARLSLRTPIPVVERLLSPVIVDAAAAVERVLGGAVSARRRLERAGREPDVDVFRAEQVVWGSLGAAAGLVGAGLLWVAGSIGAVSAVVIVLLAAAVGVMARDQSLSRLARAREERILTEFPTIAELLALAVTAGEGAVGALERVCRLSSGDLTHELSRCLADARAGASLPAALERLGERTGLPSLTRFVDGVVVAVERGTPLADVLRAQAEDVREASRRALLEAGGRKEIAMMIPVVFLVLPITVLFAVFPGIAYLSFTI
jgi:tight adherence protein C